MELENIFDNLFKSFFYSFSQSKDSNSSNDKDRINNYLEEVKKNYGGKIETTYDKLIQVTKIWTSEDGKISRKFSYFLAEDKKDAIAIEQLQDELQAALTAQNYEQCAILRDKIKLLQA
jgi:excinuclease UvrABC helicase subunit UvrB